MDKRFSSKISLSVSHYCALFRKKLFFPTAARPNETVWLVSEQCVGLTEGLSKSCAKKLKSRDGLLVHF